MERLMLVEVKRWLVFVVIFLCGASALADAHEAAGDDPSSAASMNSFPVDLARATWIDLSHAYGEDTLYWPTSPSSFELTELHKGMTDAGYFYSANTFCTPEHGGTHMDAPVHFAKGGLAAADVPLSSLSGPAVVIDVSEAAAENPNYRLQESDIREWEEIHGKIPAGAMVVMKAGWEKYWPNARQYLGGDTPGDASNLHFPSYGPDAAKFLIKQRQVSALGVDTASIDPGDSKRFPVHQIAGEANVPGLENLTNLDKLPPKGAWLVALPMKISGGSGGPARVVAIVPSP